MTSPTPLRMLRGHTLGQEPRISLRRWFSLVLFCIFSSTSFEAVAQMDEYSVKAGYLYNFSKYVTWPDRVFAAANTPFLICILGQDPFEDRLEQAIAGKSAGNGKPIQVKRVSTADREALQGCHLVFLSKSTKSRSAEIVEILKETPVLTVADFDAFALKGGIADLRIEGTRVKVDLNMAAATRADLKVSARLQQVANLVP